MLDRILESEFERVLACREDGLCDGLGVDRMGFESFRPPMVLRTE